MTLDEKVARLQVVCDELLTSAGRPTAEVLTMLGHLGRPVLDLHRLTSTGESVLVLLPGGNLVTAFVSKESHLRSSANEFSWNGEADRVRDDLTLEVTFKIQGKYRGSA